MLEDLSRRHDLVSDISNTNTPLLRGVPVIGTGQKVEGQFFPLLFDPAAIRA